jgi:hypothetical protein
VILLFVQWLAAMRCSWQRDLASEARTLLQSAAQMPCYGWARWTLVGPVVGMGKPAFRTTLASHRGRSSWQSVSGGVLTGCASGCVGPPALGAWLVLGFAGCFRKGAVVASPSQFLGLTLLYAEFG